MNKQDIESTQIISFILTKMIEQKHPLLSLINTCHRINAIINSVIESINQNSREDISLLEPVDLICFHSVEQLTEFFKSSLTDVTKKIELRNPKTDMIDEIKAYVELNYQQQIKLEDIAKNIYFVDPTYISKQFKKRYGISFSQFLISVRLNHAKQMLAIGDSLSISEIAGSVGFNDYSYFIHMYKRFFGETPGKQMKKK